MSRKPQSLAALGAGIVLLWATVGGAQEPALSTAAPGADPLAAFKTDQGLISLTKVAPELTRYRTIRATSGIAPPSL